MTARSGPEEAAEKAAVLIEALPYIRKWAGRTVVVKVGGEVIDDDATLDSFVTDVVMMRFVGINPVVVHGGGKQITEVMRKLGKEPSFEGGQRVTDAETVDIVKMVLVGTVNSRIVAAMNQHGAKAAGISGEDADLLTAAPLGSGSDVDLGFVGEIKDVDPRILITLMQSEFIPVIAPIAAGPGGSYNINADQAAGAIAASLSAQKLVFLTNVPGLYADLGDEGSLISQTDAEALELLLASGSLSDGMVPKISSAVQAVRGGVERAHILDGRIQHALLLEVFTDEGIGTMVLP